MPWSQRLDSPLVRLDGQSKGHQTNCIWYGWGKKDQLGNRDERGREPKPPSWAIYFLGFAAVGLNRHIWFHQWNCYLCHLPSLAALPNSRMCASIATVQATFTIALPWEWEWKGAISGRVCSNVSWMHSVFAFWLAVRKISFVCIFSSGKRWVARRMLVAWQACIMRLVSACFLSLDDFGSRPKTTKNPMKFDNNQLESRGHFLFWRYLS